MLLPILISAHVAFLAVSHSPGTDYAVLSQGMAYQTDEVKATKADNLLATANSIKASGFSKGTVQKFLAAIEEAAYYGNPDAISELCSSNSKEVLGIAFFRKAYFWCSLAMHNANPGEAEKQLAFVKDKLGEEWMPEAEDYEIYALSKIQAKINE
jgi:hypothetical protein